MPAMTRRLKYVLVAIAMFAAACGSSDTSASDDSLGELLPFGLIQDSEFVFEADETNPDRGIFRVITTEAAICTIVWGETDEFGNFNNSLAMNGTGIINHDVVLPGTEPGKEYQFRVQGSTADGRQFRSEVGTFTIPAIEMTDEAAGDDMVVLHGANLAQTATVVEASSTFGNGWEPENAIDGDLTTEWATQGDGDGGFITIDLGESQSIVGVEFWTRSMLNGTAITEMYTVSVDGGEPLGPFPAGNPVDPNFTSLDVSGAQFRFDVETSTGGNVGAIEVRLFAPA
jgi:hypothetical protein